MVPHSHFLYLNDILVIGRVTRCNLRAFVDGFSDYGAISGQHASWEKSFLFFRPNMPIDIR